MRGFPYDVMQHTVDVAHVENGLDFSRSSLKLFYKEYVTGTWQVTVEVVMCLERMVM